MWICEKAKGVITVITVGEVWMFAKVAPEPPVERLAALGAAAARKAWQLDLSDLVSIWIITRDLSLGQLFGAMKYYEIIY